jgi:hypothetical protein
MRTSAITLLAAGSGIFPETRKGLNKKPAPGKMRLLSHTYRALPVGNAVNGFSQCQCWRLVLPDRADLSRLTRRKPIYLIVDIIKPQVVQL